MTTIYKAISIFSSILISFSGLAQFGFEYDPSVPVINGGIYQQNAWGGGLNYTQVSDFDYDFDGDMDLFLFDRSSDNIRVLVQESSPTSHYQTDFYARDKFPADLQYRATMIDYDYDGRKDIFTYGIGGLKVYRNIGDIANGLQWELVTSMVNSLYPGGVSNLYVSASDIPAIVDVDNDGDYDVLTFHLSGYHVEYHQNQSMELYGIPDSLIFELKNECWGKFSEDPLSNQVTLNDPNSPCVGGSIPNPLKQEQHAGSSLLGIDYDNSGVMDLVVGDVSFTSLNLLINGGVTVNTDSPMISQDPMFPSNTTPVDLQLFPAAFYVDVDFDNIKDLVVGANSTGSSENETSILYYQNIGTNDSPNFVYIANDLFQSEMIDHGTGSIPTLFDYDEDGLKDLVVANFFRYKPIGDKVSTIAIYRNTGTATAPEYTFIDYNYLNLEEAFFGLHSVPTFGDIDDDNDEDMILGLEDGTLVYYENTSVGAGAVFTTGMMNYFDDTGTPIDVGGFAYPQLFDIDDDGLLDLLIGNKAGEIYHYKNIGNATTPIFQLINPTLGNVDVSGQFTPDGYASPYFFRDNNETKLFIGNIDGDLFYYDSIDMNLNAGDDFTLIDSNYLDLNVEKYSSFWIEDIDLDGNLNMFVGQDLGGLFHFNANPNSNIGLEENDSFFISVYPNPASEIVKIESSDLLKSVELYDMQGKLLMDERIQNTHFELIISKLHKGVYLLKMTTATGASKVNRIIKK